MYGVVRAGVPENLGGLTKFTFFYLRTFTIGEKSISLHKFENDVIRPLGEERIRFALNCMVVSCPRLPRVRVQRGRARAARYRGHLQFLRRGFSRACPVLGGIRQPLSRLP